MNVIIAIVLDEKNEEKKYNCSWSIILLEKSADLLNYWYFNDCQRLSKRYSQHFKQNMA